MLRAFLGSSHPELVERCRARATTRRTPRERIRTKARTLKSSRSGPSSRPFSSTLEAAKRGCDLTVVVEPDIFVRADRHVLGSAVDTLLTGVIGFMDRDGHLFLSDTARTGRVVIDVEDSGATAPRRHSRLTGLCTFAYRRSAPRVRW